jgi:serine/threonine protein phosphatase 1
MGRRLVIPDIHGCLRTLVALLDKISLSQGDTLYLLGDYIDRGPDSAGVIDLIIDMHKKGYDIRPLRGNHEQDLLDTFIEYDTPTFQFYVNRFKSSNLLATDGRIQEKYVNFINKLPYYFELPDFYLVHGGIDFRNADPFGDKRQLLYQRKTYYDVEKAQGRRIVFGHQATNIEDIIAHIASKSPIVALDNGCVYNRKHKVYDHTKMGNLLCLSLDDMWVEKVRNIDS